MRFTKITIGSRLRKYRRQMLPWLGKGESRIHRSQKNHNQRQFLACTEKLDACHFDETGSECK